MDCKDISNGYKVYESLPEGELKTSLREVLSYADSCYVSDAEDEAMMVITNVEEIEDRVVEAAGDILKDLFSMITNPGMGEVMVAEFKDKLRKKLNGEDLNIKIKK